MVLPRGNRHVFREVLKACLLSLPIISSGTRVYFANEICTLQLHGFFKIDFRERRGGGDRGREKKRQTGRGGERERDVCCSTYSYIHWLILVCALPGDGPCDLGVIWTMLSSTELPSQAKLPCLDLCLSFPLLGLSSHCRCCGQFC